MASRNNSNNKEIRITIISSCVVILTNIMYFYFSQTKEVKEVLIHTPNLEKVDFKQYLGLEKNKTYRFQVDEIIDTIGNGRTKHKNYEINVKVIDYQKHNKYHLYILDNDILHPTKEKKTNGILLCSNIVYFLDNVQLNELKEVLSKKNKESSYEKINYSTMYVLPFFDKQRIGEFGISIRRNDNRYIEYIQKEASTFYYDGEKMIERTKYRIYFETAPDFSYIEFIPYIGFIGTNYRHNGSIVEYTSSLLDTKK